MRKLMLPLLCMIVVLSGCASLQNMTVVQKSTLLQSTSKAGTVVGICSYTQDVEKRFKTARTIRGVISEVVMPVFSMDNLEIDVNTVNLLFEKIPLEIRPFLEGAFGLFVTFGFGTNDILSVDEVVLLKAFFLGILDGCDAVLFPLTTEG